MKAIVRRLARPQDRFVPQEDEQSLLLRERLCRARERLESMGLSLPPLVYDGPPLSLGEQILLARRHPLVMVAGENNTGTKCAT
jgi:hypothetical protein